VKEGFKSYGPRERQRSEPRPQVKGRRKVH
jgi:hypothetical protein